MTKRINNQYAPLYEGNKLYEVAGEGENKHALQWKGNNQKRILILSSQKLEGEDSNLLKKILLAVGITLDDVALVEKDKHPDISLSLLKSKIDFQKLIAFGFSAQDLHFNTAAGFYRLVRLEGTDLLFSHTLTELNDDKGKKDRLWIALQKMFALINV